MTTLQVFIMVAGFTIQVAGLFGIAWMIHRQDNRFSPGEAAIYKEMRRVLESRQES